MASMKALFKAAPQRGALELREVERPVPRADEVVIDVAGASICGSDLHIAEWHPMAQWTVTPVIMGHEFAGVIREVGSDVEDFKPGEAVAVESVIWCGHCLGRSMFSQPRYNCVPSNSIVRSLPMFLAPVLAEEKIMASSEITITCWEASLSEVSPLCAKRRESPEVLT